MAISILSSEVKTSNGNLTIPVGCSSVIALVLGTTNPTINGVAMTQKCSSGVSISEMPSPPAGTIACTVGQSTRFVYLRGAGLVRSAIAKEEKPFSEDIASSTTDLVLGVSTPNTTSLTVDGGAMTYLDNYSRGYKASADSTATCGADGSDFTLYAAFVSVQQKKFVSKSHWW